jgi:crotonobetainyl-CoA:carnitine CoA-transferase CaiB-like acyl-CoA transferase|nr:MAG: CoA transferase [Pseudomonadota bacterium]
MAAPLSHIRVLDLSRVLAGPLATQFLADMGAEVIKIERPRSGDDTRAWGPPFAVEPTENDPGISAYFACCNRGKQSVTVDITHPKGQELIRKLAAKSDVVIENFKVGGLAKYGLDYQSLKQINPGIIYCSITGFGQTGPYAPRAGYDFLVQAMGGLMSITGEPDDVPGGGPVKVGVAISDQMAGMFALSAILTALLKRERTGEGEYIDVALLDSTVASLINQASTYLVSGIVPQRMGNAHPTVVPYQAFRTADGHIILAIGNDGQFQRFCAVAGLEGLADDERYRTNSARILNRDTLIPKIAEAIRQRTTAEWVSLLESQAVPCGPINTIDQVFADPQVQARGMRRVLEHEKAGPLPVTANPVRMASHDTTASKAPPLLGENTEEVLSRLLDLSPDDIAALRNEGVV